MLFVTFASFVAVKEAAIRDPSESRIALAPNQGVAAVAGDRLHQHDRQEELSAAWPPERLRPSRLGTRRPQPVSRGPR